MIRVRKDATLTALGPSPLHSRFLLKWAKGFFSALAQRQLEKGYANSIFTFFLQLGFLCVCVVFLFFFEGAGDMVVLPAIFSVPCQFLSPWKGTQASIPFCICIISLLSCT